MPDGPYGAIGFSMSSSHGLPDLIHIPAGNFLFGAVDPDENQIQRAEVYVPAFAIARLIVTVSEWLRFLSATGYAWGVDGPATPEERHAWMSFVALVDPSRPVVADNGPND